MFEGDSQDGSGRAIGQPVERLSGAARRALEHGQPRQAEMLAREALRLAPGDPDATVALARSLAARGAWMEALAACRKAAWGPADASPVLLEMGIILRAVGRLPEAEAAYRAILDRDPGSVAARVNLSHALIELGRTADALAEAERAIVLRPRLAEAHNAVGAAQMRLGRPDAARAALRQALALAPGLDAARRNLDALEDDRPATVDPHFALAAYHEAARRLSLEADGAAPLIRAAGTAVSGRVLSSAGRARWLKVRIAEPGRTAWLAWSGDAAITTFGFPEVPALIEERRWRTARHLIHAQLFELGRGTPLSTTPFAGTRLAVPGAAWFDALGRLLDRVRGLPTDRRLAEPAALRSLVDRHFPGACCDLEADAETVHGDLHWANLAGPDLQIFDWERWGRGPAGYDAACLEIHSLGHAALAAAVHGALRAPRRPTATAIGRLCAAAAALERSALNRDLVAEVPAIRAYGSAALAEIEGRRR